MARLSWRRSTSAEVAPPTPRLVRRAAGYTPRRRAWTRLTYVSSGLDAPTPSTVLSPRATYLTAALRSAGRSRASSWPPHAHPADSATSAKRLRSTDSPRPVGPQPHHGLRLARSGPRARLGLWGPSPTTACGSHYHAAASSRVRRYQGASGKAIGRIAGSVTPASR